MLGFLFRGLTAEPQRGAALFDAVTAEAREPHWYVEGTVPDTLDGRFAVLATVTALALVRLEQARRRAATRASVALTERFIEVMECEHRELGLGDPTLGKTVRKLVGSLARRTELWRAAVAGERGLDRGGAREPVQGRRRRPTRCAHQRERAAALWRKARRDRRSPTLEQGRIA